MSSPNIAEYNWCQAVMTRHVCDDDDCGCVDDRLHAANPAAVEVFGDWDGDPVDGATACGIGVRLIIPGVFSRMSTPRCETCCERTGLPRGIGSPKNDDRCRAILGMDNT